MKRRISIDGVVAGAALILAYALVGVLLGFIAGGAL